MDNQGNSAILQILRTELPDLKERYGVEQIGLFGSFARNEQREDSDIDLVVVLSRPLGLKFIELAEYLEMILGRKVDLITAATLTANLSNPRRAHIARDIQKAVIYV